MIWPDGNSYSGLWKDDMIDKYGKFNYFDGSHYEGEYD